MPTGWRKCEWPAGYSNGVSAALRSGWAREDAQQLESVVEQFRHLRVGRAVWRAQHDAQQAVAAAARGGDQAAKRLLGPTGFQSVGTRVGAQQFVEVDERIGLVRGRCRDRDGGYRGNGDQARIVRLQKDGGSGQVIG